MSEAVVVKKCQKLQREILKLYAQLDKAVARSKKAQEDKNDILRRMRAKSEETREFLSNYTAF